MEEMRSVPLFDWFKIIWEDGYNSPVRTKETFIITNNSVSFIRTSVNELEINDPFSDIKCKWHFKTNDLDFEARLNAVCLNFLNHYDSRKNVERDGSSIFTIEARKHNDKLIKRQYKDTLEDNDLEVLLELVEEFIPKHAFKPFFINGSNIY